MLDPNNRTLLIDSIRPPIGYRFVEGVALTYTLDLTTLLTIPLHLAVLGSGKREELLKDPVALLEALRRTASNLAIVCQHGRIAVPTLPHVLFGLLEKSVVEVNAPNGGVFHPKVWALRYDDVAGGASLVRLIVLSRNLTPDRCWDLSLSLEGTPGGRVVAKNRPIADLISRVPVLAARAPSERVAQVISSLANQVLRTDWDELPAGFEEIGFQVLGLDKKPWNPAPSNRLAVISPFVRAEALANLIETTDEPVALISRPEELARVDAATLKQFSRCLTLHERAETDDGEDAEATTTAAQLSGLHAKAYITELSWYTTLYLGSANATNASLLSVNNVEVLVELTGRTSKVGGIEDLLGEESLRDYLTDFVPPDSPPPLSLEEQADEVLNVARCAIAQAGLHITIEHLGEDTYYYAIKAKQPLLLPRIISNQIWPVSLQRERAVDGAPLLLTDGTVKVGPVSAATLTSFIAFELKSDVCEMTICFVLNLPVANMPDIRDAAVLRTVVQNREGFLRYLLMLLRDDTQPLVYADLLSAMGGPAARWRHSVDEMPLLEELTRAFSRDPARLHAIRRMVEQLQAAPNGHEIVPPEFLEVWNVYQALLTAETKPAQVVEAEEVDQ